MCQFIFLSGTNHQGLDVKFEVLQMSSNITYNINCSRSIAHVNTQYSEEFPLLLYEIEGINIFLYKVMRMQVHIIIESHYIQESEEEYDGWFSY